MYTAHTLLSGLVPRKVYMDVGSVTSGIASLTPSLRERLATEAKEAKANPAKEEKETKADAGPDKGRKVDVQA